MGFETRAWLAVFLLETLVAGSSAHAAGPTSLYWVDLEAAVLRVEDGAKARRLLAGKQEALQKAVDRREAELIARRADLSAVRYAAELKAHHARIERDQESLRVMQDELLQPVLSRLRTSIEARNRGVRKRRIVTLQDGLLIGPPPACERTEWLVRAYADPSLAPSENRTRCSVKQIMTVDVDRVMASLPQATAVTSRLQAFMEGRQVDLNRRRRQKREIEEKVRLTGDRRWKEELAFFSADLDRHYARYHAELRVREQAEEDALYGKVADRLRAVSARVLDVWFAESKVTDALPHCDATEWATGAVDAPRITPPPACGASTGQD